MAINSKNYSLLLFYINIGSVEHWTVLLGRRSTYDKLLLFVLMNVSHDSKIYFSHFWSKAKLKFSSLSRLEFKICRPALIFFSHFQPFRYANFLSWYLNHDSKGEEELIDVKAGLDIKAGLFKSSETFGRLSDERLWN